jgi:hypothetical protein
MDRHITSTQQVFDALGGTHRISQLTGASYTAAYNWLTNGLPARTYLILTQALAWRGFTADPDLWGMTRKRRTKEPARQVVQTARQRARP